MILKLFLTGIINVFKRTKLISSEVLRLLTYLLIKLRKILANLKFQCETVILA